jgi:hypothetical protein
MLSLVARNVLGDLTTEVYETLAPHLVDPAFVTAFFTHQRLLFRLQIVVSCAPDEPPARLLAAEILPPEQPR